MSVRRLPVDKRMVWRRRKGMQPDPDHVIALFSLAADVALLYVLLLALSPNPPKDTEGGREDSGRGWVRELQGRWPGPWGRWGAGGRSSGAAQGP